MVRAADQRASDADRDEVVDVLRTAAGEGRIGHDELDERVARALSARTFRELNATIEDIPRSDGTRAPAARTRISGWAITAVRNEPWLLVFVIPVLAMTVAIALTAITMWMVVAVAVLALGGRPRDPARLIAGKHRAGFGRRSGTVQGSARSSWRWI